MPITLNELTPSEVFNMFEQKLSEQQSDVRLVCVRGVYEPRPQNQNWRANYDEIKDPNNPAKKMTIVLNSQIRANLVRGQLVNFFGSIKRNMKDNCNIELQLEVTRIDIVQEQHIDPIQEQRIRIRERKVARGAKPVKSLLTDKIIKGEKPRVAIIYPPAGQTLGDFENGIRAASNNIDFIKTSVTLQQTSSLCNMLRHFDTQNFDAIAIIRGGGFDSTKDVDKPEVLETVANLNTPFISGVGHEPEIIFLRQIADYFTPTPQGLGQFFDELVRTALELKNDFRGKIEREYQTRLTALQNQVNEANKTITATNQSINNITKERDNLQKNLDIEKNRTRNLENELESAGNKKAIGCSIFWLLIIAALVAVYFFILKKPY